MKQKQNHTPSKNAKASVAEQKPHRPLTEQVKSILSNKYLQLLLLGIVAIVFYVNYDAMFDKKLDMNGDNIHYYSLAKSLHDGTGYSNVMGFEMTPHTHFPPGYSAFISVLMNFTKAGSFIPVKKANGYLLCFSIFLMFYIIKRITNNNVLLAFMAAILFCFQKDLLRWSTIMMSEMLYLFLTAVIILTALILYRKKSFKEYSKLDYAALVLMLLSVAYVYFVRTMGISMILGLVGWLMILVGREALHYWKNRQESEKASVHRGKLFYYGCLVALVLLSFGAAKVSWDIRNKAIGHEKTDYIGDFKMKGGNGEVMSTWSDWTDRIYNNAKAYYAHLMPETILNRPFEQKAPITSSDKMVGFFVFALVVIGFWRLGLSGLLIFCYLAVTFAVLLVWPEQYTSVRYYVVTIPFLLFLFLHGIYNVAYFIFSKTKVDFINKYVSAFAFIPVVLAVLFWLCPNQLKAQGPYRDLAKNSYKKILNDQNCLNFFESLEWCKTNLPDSARTICRKPELFYINTGFKKSVSFPHYAPEDTIINYLNKVNATHVILDNWFKHAYTTIYPAIKKYPEKFKVIHKIADVDTVNHVNPVYIAEYNRDWGYHGQLVDGKKEGEGSYYYQDGRRYVGNYKNDQPDGEGTFYNEDGSVRFKGTWKDGQYWNGKGFAVYGDKKYDGEFRGGRPNGFGVYSDAQGNVLAKGIWKDGALVARQ